MIRSIASLSKENGAPCIMMNNALFPLSGNTWLVVLNDNVVKAEFGQDSNFWDNECISLKGKDVQTLQYLELNEFKCIVVGLCNEIMISDLDGVQLFHKKMDMENATCALIQSDSNNHPVIFIGTSLGRILRINTGKDSDWELNEEFKVSQNIWTIFQFKDFLVISLESGELEFWKNTGSWETIAVIESKYPCTSMYAFESEYLLVARFNGNIDILNSDLCTLISIGAHTGYISGIAFSSNKVINTK
jgi:hypothetical protein